MMEETPVKIVVYHCRNLRLFKDGEQKVFCRQWPGLSMVSIPCSGKVEAHHLLKTLASGAQGVLILACSESACQYLEGSSRSRKRVDYARLWLQKVGVSTERLDFVRVPPMDRNALENLLREFFSKIQSLEVMPAVAKA